MRCGNRQLLSVASWLAVILGALLAPTTALAAPRSQDITIDGNLADWDLVMANPANVVVDGDGSRVPCNQTPDRDCPVSFPAYDIQRFAVTWNAQDVFFRIERLGLRGGGEYYWIYLDPGADGWMHSGDFVARIDADACTGNLFNYRAGVTGGDAMTDASGFGDGHRLSGFENGAIPGAAPRCAVVPGGLAIEAAIRWSDLGLTPGAAFDWHVAMSTGTNIPAQIVENLGGPDGRRGTLAYRGVDAGPDTQIGTGGGAAISLPHAITNTGNVAARYAYRVESACGRRITIWHDADGDGNADFAAARDATGNGSFNDPGDSVWPLADLDGDGQPDTGMVPMGASGFLILDVDVPLDDGCTTDTVTLTVVDAADATISDVVSDTVRSGVVTIWPDSSLVAAAGDAAWHAHGLLNGQPDPVTCEISASSASGWPIEIWLDPNGDGSPLDAVLMADDDGDGKPGVSLGPRGISRFFVRTVVPPGAPLGASDIVIVRAELWDTPRAFVTDTTAVATALRIDPSHTVDQRDERYGGPGGSVWFAHVITNARAVAESPGLQLSSDAGWSVSAWLDPDGDGRPYDAEPAPPTLPEIPGNGGRLAMLLRTDVPAGATPGDRTRITALATSPATGATSTVWDDALASIVALYEDQAHIVNQRAFPPCATVFAQATGLPPMDSSYRFTWRDASGLAIRITPVATSEFGSCEDARTLNGSEQGMDLTVELEQLSGSAWTVVDTARHDIADAVAEQTVALARSHAHLVDDVAAAVTVRMPAQAPATTGLVARCRVLSPDRASCLGPGGAFGPFTGTEFTAESSLPPVIGGATASWTMALQNAAFNVTGPHPVEAWVVLPCGVSTPITATTLTVIDDPDRDGVDTATELAIGSNPYDADTDDDGLPDGAEGLGDADGDAVPDVLECDADDDGLTDGVERGVILPGPGTDVARGCFVADADPTTTTDPRSRDTDAGGLPDGAEDRDGNGRRDAGETDPLDPGDDDPMSCDPAMPVAIADLRASRAGGQIHLSWTPVTDRCTHYVIEGGGNASLLSTLVPQAWAPRWTDTAPPSAALRAVRFYSIRARSLAGGLGP